MYGKQQVYTNGRDPKIKEISWKKQDIEKPAEIKKLNEAVQNYGNFVSVKTITSNRKPYGFGTDVIKKPAKYELKSSDLSTSRTNDSDLLMYTHSAKIYYLNGDATFDKGKAYKKYKVFVPYAWGNMSENCGLGGSYADVIIASPHEICLETYLESGCFDDFETARKHAKYLMTRFARALLYLNKFSQHSTTAWGDIPIQDYHEDWWDKSIAEIDEELFKKYNVPDDIAQFVRENIQIKTEANIVNFTTESKA